VEAADRIPDPAERILDDVAYWSLVALAALLPVALNPYGNAYFDAPKGGLLRFLALLGVAAWAGRSVLAGKFKWTRTALDWPIGALLAASSIATALALNRHVSFYGGLNTFDGTLNLACYAAFFYLAVNFVTTRARLRNLLVAVLAGAGIVSVLAVLERVGIYLLPSTIAPGGVDPTRSAATFGNPVYLGAYLTIVIPVSVALFLYLRLGRQDDTTPDTVSPAWPISGLVAVEIAALIFTQGRAAWLGTAIGLAVTLGLILSLRETFRWRQVALLLVPFLAAGALYLGVGAVSRAPSAESLSERAKSTAAVSSGSAFNRLYMWRMTLPMLVARPVHGRSDAFDATIGPVRLPAGAVRPLFGYGLDFYLELFPKWRPIDWYVAIKEDAFPAQPHNDLLQVAVGQGLIGLAAYLAVLGALIVTCGQAAARSKRPMQRFALAGLLGSIAAYIVQLQFSFTVAAVAPFFWVAAGMAVSLAHRDDRGSRSVELELPTRTDASRIAALLVLLGLVAWGTVGAYRFVAADARLRATQDAVGIGAYDTALDLAYETIALNPHESRYPMVSARYFEDAYATTGDGRYADAALDLARTAQALDPYLTEPYFTQASVYRQMARRTGSAPLQQAATLYRRVLALDPYNEDGLFNLALTLYDQRAYRQSADLLRRALRLKPADADAYEALGAAYAKEKRYKEAKDAFRRALRLGSTSPFVQQALKELEAKDPDGIRP